MPECGDCSRFMERDAEMRERRKDLFSKLGDTLNADDKGKMVVYIMQLWKYIADEHGETLCIEVEEE